MKKILLAQDLQDLFLNDNSFFKREDLAVFTAASNEEILQIHQWEAVDLIIARLGMPGMSIEDLFESISAGDAIRAVASVVLYEDEPGNQERCKRLGATAIFALPVDPKRLYARILHDLDIAPRAVRRAALAVDIEGKYRDRLLPLRSSNISSRGMLIKSGEPLFKGDGLAFSFSLPDNTPVNGYGKITRAAQPREADSYSYGIKFTIIEPGARAAIESIVNA